MDILFSDISILIISNAIILNLVTLKVGIRTSVKFLPRCMECQRGLAARKLSVRPSVCLYVRLSVCQTRGL